MKKFCVNVNGYERKKGFAPKDHLVYLFSRDETISLLLKRSLKPQECAGNSGAGRRVTDPGLDGPDPIFKKKQNTEKNETKKQGSDKEKKISNSQKNRVRIKSDLN